MKDKKIVGRKRTKGIVDDLVDLVTGNPTVGDMSPIAKELRIPAQSQKRNIDLGLRRSSKRIHES